MKYLPSNTDGFYNLFIIVSVLSFLRFLIEDYKEFGFIMSIPLSHLSLPDILYFLFLLIFLCIRSCICFYLSSRLYIICLLFSEVVVFFINIFYIKHVYLSGFSLIIDLILLMKLISYYRSSDNLNDKSNTTKYDKSNDNISKSSNPPSSHSPTITSNLNITSFLYFLIIPTLCYSSTYSYKNRDYSKIFYKSLLLLIGLFLFLFITDQYSIPSIYRIIRMRDLYTVLENAINLSLSTAFLFLIFFHLVFVCILDILSELTYFKASFYKAWWNSNTVSEFWTKWNIPVHKWIKNHIYIPLKKKGYTKTQSRILCFLVSAIFHEYVLSVSTKHFCGYVFLGMMAQIPLICISEYIYKRYPRMANYFFWGSFCIIGQPVIVVLYYRSKELSKIKV